MNVNRNSGRFRTPSQGPELPGAAEGQGVVAAFDDLEAARKAIEALGRAGLEGQRITLRGPGANEAAQETSTAEADAGFVGHWLSYVAAGALIGGVMGMVLSIGFVGLSGADVSSGDLLWIAVLSALGLGIAGALIASMYSMQATETWALTFQQSAKGATVGVQSVDPDEIDRAATILREHQPRNMRRVDAGSSLRRSRA